MLRYLTAGESHGPCLTAIIEGLPSGLAIDIEAINSDLARRQRGYGRGGRMRIEKDQVEVVSGMRFGKTLGSPLTLVIRNRDWDTWKEVMSVNGSPQGLTVTAPRPGHADLAGIQKYGHPDIRNILERASARETAIRTAVGGVAKQLLAAVGIKLAAYVTQIGEVCVQPKGPYSFELAKKAASSDLSCFDSSAEEAMVQVIQAAKDQGDTLGGAFEIMVNGVMPGLGSHVHWDRRLDTRLAAAMMSIPAIKAVEFGVGVQYAALPGSEAHDEIFFTPEQGYFRSSNRAGGVEGGISNGEAVIVKATMKAIPTLMTPLASVDIRTKQPVPANSERSDVCAVPAASVVGEAMAAIVLAEALIEKFGGDTLEDLTEAVNFFRERIGKS